MGIKCDRKLTITPILIDFYDKKIILKGRIKMQRLEIEMYAVSLCSIKSEFYFIQSKPFLKR